MYIMMIKKSIKLIEIIYSWLLLIVLLWLDLGTKYLFYDLGIYKDLFLIEPIINMGISFSLDVSYFIVLPFSLLALWWFIYLFYYKSFPSIITLLLIAGTLWNLYDRVVYEGVRDFIVMPWLFVFNIADIFLTLGITWVLIYVYNQKKK
jgi:lipoprotein signal peptidase